MNKKKLGKVTGVATASFLIAGTTAFTAFAAMPSGTAVIGNKAYDLNYVNDPANQEEITAAMVAADFKVYVKDFAGNWIVNETEAALTDLSVIPAVTYKSSTGVITNYDVKDGAVVTNNGGSNSGNVNVSGVSAISNTMVQVKFNQKVDKTTAESLTNYKIDGVKLSAPGFAGTYAILESDGVTLDIFLAPTQSQDTKVTFAVAGVLDATTFKEVTAFAQEVLFKDVTNPTLVSATISNGNKTLTLLYSEPVNGTGNKAIDVNQYTINGNALTAYGVNQAGSAPAFYTTAALKTDYRKVVLNFDTALPEGQHTIAVKNNGAIGQQVLDAASLAVLNGTATFTATNDTTGPQVLSTTAIAGTSGTVEIKFNEAVGTIVSGYSLNGSTVIPTLKAGTLDTLVVTAPVSVGANLLVIPATQTDKFGNKMGEFDTRISVSAALDSVAPTVQNVYAITDQKVRVVFSENINNSFATTKANYVIKDAAGDVVFSSAVNVAGFSLTCPVGSANNMVDIDFTSALPGSTYTLEVTNLRDGSNNVMAKYTGTFNSPDVTAPTLATSGSKAVRSANTIEVFFNEPMDATSLLTKANYRYQIGGVFAELPSSAVLEAGKGNKSVKISFPGTIDVTSITDIKVLSLKDTAGNGINSGSEQTGAIQVSLGVNPTLVNGTAKVYADDSKAWVEFNTDLDLSTALASDFTDAFLVGVTPEAADVATITGKTVRLTYTDASEVAAIKAAGSGITVANAYGPTANTKNAYGDRFTTPGSGTLRVTDAIAPEITASPLSAVSGTNTATLAFNEAISDGNKDSYKDDFVFESNGQVLTVTSVNVIGSSVIYTFKENISSNLKATPIATPDIKDVAGNAYVPTTLNKFGFTLNYATSLTAVVAQGTVAGTTKITATPGVGNTLATIVQPGAFAAPAVGSTPVGTTAYTSAADLVAAAGQHVGLYELDGTGKVVRFVDLTIGAGDVAVAAPAIVAVSAKGTVVGTTAITAAPGVGNTLATVVQPGAFATPLVGSTPAGTTAYTSGANLVAAAGQHVGLYELDGTGKVVKFVDITVAAGDVATLAGVLSATITPTAGTAVGDTNLAIAGLTAGNKLYINTTAGAGATAPISGTARVAATYSMDISVTADKTLGVGTFDVVEVDGSDNVVGFGTVTITLAEVK